MGTVYGILSNIDRGDTEMNQTAQTISQRMDLIEAITRNSKPITIESLSDDGEWIARTFANESAAKEYEYKMQKNGVSTKRAG